MGMVQISICLCRSIFNKLSIKRICCKDKCLSGCMLCLIYFFFFKVWSCTLGTLDLVMNRKRRVERTKVFGGFQGLYCSCGLYHVLGFHHQEVEVWKRVLEIYKSVGILTIGINMILNVV